MKRTGLTHNITGLFILPAIVAMNSPAVALADRPNVVILFTDDQGTLDANCYGSKDLHTPNIDNLAATGVRFTQAYAHTVCCPARAALKRREAARLAVEEALLRAQEDVAGSRARFEWRAAQEKAARSGAHAAEEDLQVALAHIEVTPDAFSHLAKAAPDAVERMSRVRTTAVDAARARVALARAYAWPHVGGER